MHSSIAESLKPTRLLGCTGSALHQYYHCVVALKFLRFTSCVCIASCSPRIHLLRLCRLTYITLRLCIFLLWSPHVDLHICAFLSCSVRCGVEVTATSDSPPLFCSLPPPGATSDSPPRSCRFAVFGFVDKQTLSQERCQQQVPECDESSHFIDKNENPNTPRPH